MKLAIAIATAGRRDGLSETLSFLKNQTRLPDAVYICPASEADLDRAAIENYPCPVKVVSGARGLPAQRNAIMRASPDMDVLFFIDDDYLPDPLAMAELETLFAARPGMGIATGHVIADGATTIGISYEDASGMIAKLGPLPAQNLTRVFNGYGCNMAVRMSIVRQHSLEFDENLPLYAWWEDVDFSRRLAPYGEILKTNRLRGVHQGSKSGRTPGKRLGYSQVMNIVYMMRKGSIPFNVGAVRIARNVFANLARTFAPEPWVDRRGRLVGNLIAMMDAMAGRVDPKKILSM